MAKYLLPCNQYLCPTCFIVSKDMQCCTRQKVPTDVVDDTTAILIKELTRLRSELSNAKRLIEKYDEDETRNAMQLAAWQATARKLEERLNEKHDVTKDCPVGGLGCFTCESEKIQRGVDADLAL